MLMVGIAPHARSACPPFLVLWGSAGLTSADPGKFNYPTGITTDGSGAVYVCDNHNHRIQKFTPQGNLLTIFPSDDAYALAWDESQGILYVPEPNSGSVGYFDREGNRRGTIPMPVVGYETVVYIAIDAQGTLFCRGGDRIHVYDRDHRHVRTWTLPVPGLEPWGIAVGASGVLHVAMGVGVCVATFDSLGHQVGSFPLPAGSTPRGIACDAAGNIWVTLANKDLVRQYTPAGMPLCILGGGSRSIPGYVSVPYGVAVARDGSVYTTDHGFHRVQRFNDPTTITRRSTWGALKLMMR